jgi:hypothetical protein
MWLGNGKFDPYGYQKKDAAYLKGAYEEILPNFVYKVVDKGPPRGSQQYWVVPVDQNGNENGPPAIKTAGNMMGSLWSKSKDSTELNSFDFYPGAG